MKDHGKCSTRKELEMWRIATAVELLRGGPGEARASLHWDLAHDRHDQPISFCQKGGWKSRKIDFCPALSRRQLVSSPARLCFWF